MTKMTTLEAYAQHGSVSYGEISADRLRLILLGDVPERKERSCVRQALLEMPGTSAFGLAKELGVTFDVLNARALALLGEGLPS